LRLIKLERKRCKTRNFTVPAHNPSLHEAFAQRWPHHIVRDALVRQYSLKERYFDKARFDAGYADLKRFTLERCWQPFIPTRAENCALMAAGRKIEYRWPLLDIRLVRLFLAIPSEENYHRGMGRYLHRRAVNGIVPEMVAWKQTKDMGRITVPSRGEAHPWPGLPVSGLPPALAACIETEELDLQIETGRQNMCADMGKDKKMQYSRNMRALRDISAWMEFTETRRPGIIEFRQAGSAAL